MVDKAREGVFNGLVVAGIGALGIIFALSPAKMENEEWVGVGLWAAALAVMVALPQGGTRQGDSWPVAFSSSPSSRASTESS